MRKKARLVTDQPVKCSSCARHVMISARGRYKEVAVITASRSRGASNCCSAFRGLPDGICHSPVSLKDTQREVTGSDFQCEQLDVLLAVISRNGMNKVLCVV